MQTARAAQKNFFDDLNYPNKKQYIAFPSYTRMSRFAMEHGCKNILEIGAGLSTAVWASYAEQNGANISTVDANLARMKSYVRGTRHESLVSKHVNIIDGVTINSDEFVDFYTGAPKTSFGGVDVLSIQKHIEAFQCNNCSLKRRFKVRRISNRWSWSAQDLITDGTTLSLPRKLLDLFSGGQNFDNEIAFLRDAESRGVAGVITELTKTETSWDLIFFDSGELASMIEWPKLKDKIAVGGFAAFHDIYFPKSIKNIIPCAALTADPDWETLICDDSTKQGLLIARRLR